MPTILHSARRLRPTILVRLVLTALMLAAVGRHYVPGAGFSRLLQLSEDGHATETTALRGVPHYHYPPGQVYDAQSYVQMALYPLLKNPELELALDAPQYRSRRILFAWTAWLAGLGRPAWVVQAYALQNVAFWLALAWWLARRYPADDWRGLAIWIAVMFSHGLLSSVRLALLDGPSLLLIAIAISWAERGRPFASAALVGVSGLGRETNLLAAAGLRWRFGRDRQSLVRLALCAALVAVPILLWMDYLRSIYRTTVLVMGSQMTWPLSAYLQQWQQLWRALGGSLGSHIGSALALIALSTQAIFLLSRIQAGSLWWRVGFVNALLMLVIGVDVWAGDPGAATRVLLPMTLSFNLLLPRTRAFWPLFAAGNLTVLLAWRAMA